MERLRLKWSKLQRKIQARIPKVTDESSKNELFESSNNNNKIETNDEVARHDDAECARPSTSAMSHCDGDNNSESAVPLHTILSEMKKQLRLLSFNGKSMSIDEIQTIIVTRKVRRL